MWERLQYHLTKGSLLMEQHNHLYVYSTLAHLVVWPPLQDLGQAPLHCWQDWLSRECLRGYLRERSSVGQVVRKGP